MIDKLIPLICMLISIAVTAELAPPVLSKPSTIFQSRISIAISSQDTSSGVWISYTLDGTVPDINSFEATPSKWRFEFDSTVTLSAICIKKHTNDGNVLFEKSAVVIATYTKKLTIPLMEPFLFNFEDSLCLHLKAPEKGAKVYFTVDGSEPSENSILFHDNITLRNTTILRYIAVKHNCINSEIMTRKIVKL